MRLEDACFHLGPEDFYESRFYVEQCMPIHQVVDYIKDTRKETRLHFTT